ncbi:MAG: replication-associated recombination protein A [Defluviitaleaceae bacterium]|nr:replication-associated recombination protein A [Defluviitaleaceae bacterium]
MDIFEYRRGLRLEKDAPLAARMRPKDLDGFIGQEHIVGKGKLLRRAITADKLSSMIFHGPPGSGKTTLARLIAGTTESVFVTLNATTSGVKDIKSTVDDAKHRLGSVGKRTISFIDEIHRFNKAQQDALLPHVEDGTLILIGATTENPYFEVNKALLSRSMIYGLKPLVQADVLEIMRRAIADGESGLGLLKLSIDEEALTFLADMANGDARAALNAIELAAATTAPGADGVIAIGLDVAQECIQKRAINYDTDGDNHYDTISAFIKSMRGSDPDAALYYLARMLYAGESPEFIARRIVIAASEDVGNADPHALLVADAAARAVQMVGLPECQIILAQAAAYISCAPKSNASCVGIYSAMDDVKSVRISQIPSNLRDPNTSMGSTPYVYPHDYPGGYVPAEYLPRELSGKIYYRPSDNGIEKRIKESLTKLGKKYD